MVPTPKAWGEKNHSDLISMTGGEVSTNLFCMVDLFLPVLCQGLNLDHLLFFSALISLCIC